MVDPATAGLQATDHTVRTVQVLREDACGEPEVGGIGAADGLLLVVEVEHHHHRSEYLFTDDRHVVVAAVEHRRRDEETAAERAVRQPLAADQHARAFCLAAFDVGHDLAQVLLGDQRAHLGLGIRRVADLHLFDPYQKPPQELLLDRAMDEHPRGVGTDLARGIEVGEQRARDRVVEIRIREYQERRLATQLERHMFKGRGSLAHHRTPGLDGTGHGYFGDAGVSDQQATGVDRTLHHLEDAVGHARSLHDAGQFRCAEGRQFGRLEDHGIAEGERRRGLPAGGLHGIVPSTDARHHAERLTPRVAEACRTEIDVLACRTGRERSEVLEALDARDDIDDTGLLDRLARVAHLYEREFVVALAQDVGDLAQDAGALGAAQRRPRGLRCLRAAHRFVDLRRVGDREFSEQLAGGGVEAREARRACTTDLARRPRRLRSARRHAGRHAGGGAEHGVHMSQHTATQGGGIAASAR